MTHSIVRTETPEEREYARYLSEIELRRRRVADLQADLAVFQEQLGRFNAEYHARVGVLFVELDRIDLAIAEYEFRIERLRTNPGIEPEELERKARQEFAEQREQIHEEEEEARYYEREHREERKRPELDDASMATLRGLYLELVKRFHPDLAKTEEERLQRESVMKGVNAAFHERDIERLQAIGLKHQVDETAFESKSIGEKLVWAIREISRLDEIIASLIAERSAMAASDLGNLWKRRESGEDVIGRLERNLHSSLAASRERLERLRLTYRELAHGEDSV